MAYILARQATSLLQRTRLNVTVACQAWHAKNTRHILLGARFEKLPPVFSTDASLSDIVDYMEPTMMIVGSRGVSQLNGYVVEHRWRCSNTDVDLSFTVYSSVRPLIIS